MIYRGVSWRCFLVDNELTSEDNLNNMKIIVLGYMSFWNWKCNFKGNRYFTEKQFKMSLRGVRISRYEWYVDTIKHNFIIAVNTYLVLDNLRGNTSLWYNHVPLVTIYLLMRSHGNGWMAWRWGDADRRQNGLWWISPLQRSYIGKSPRTLSISNIFLSL